MTSLLMMVSPPQTSILIPPCGSRLNACLMEASNRRQGTSLPHGDALPGQSTACASAGMKHRQVRLKKAPSLPTSARRDGHHALPGTLTITAIRWPGTTLELRVLCGGTDEVAT